MDTVLEKISKLFPNQDDEYFKKLESLWDSMQFHFPLQIGPFPVDHGKNHITRVLENLIKLISPLIESNFFRQKRLAETFAAAMIHDIGMEGIRTLNTPEERTNARENHANLDIIKTRLSSDSFHRSTSGDKRYFSNDEFVNIARIASIHANDLYETWYDKLQNLIIDVEPEDKYLVKAALLIRLSDFLDIGSERFCKNYKTEPWDEIQMMHIWKHLVINTNISEPRFQITIKIAYNLDEIDTLIKSGKISENISELEKYAIIRSIHEEAKEQIKIFNNHLSGEINWSLKELDEELFGKIYPLSANVELFSNELSKAINEWKKKNEKKTVRDPFEVDLMATTLFSRFVEEKEKQINSTLIELKEKGFLGLRVILLDPETENQQFLEIYEAQKYGKQEIYKTKDNNKKDVKRSVLSKYNINNVLEKDEKYQGDGYRTLQTINDSWTKNVNGNSFIEVRLTQEIMYSSINRFGNRIIISPYRQNLFNESMALIVTSKSPLFPAYTKEFNSYWEVSNDSRIAIHKYAKPEINPLLEYINSKHINKSPVQLKTIPALQYEKDFIKNNLTRITSVLEKVQIEKELLNTDTANHEILKQKLSSINDQIIPYEIEIQPNENCDFECLHCIGGNLNNTNSKKRNGSFDLSEVVESIFMYGENGLKIERVRLSGLKGDPFSDETRAQTIKIINKAISHNKKVVVFTNGIGLNNVAVLDALTKVDNVHISLDAAEAETFEFLKGTTKENFDNIRIGVRRLIDRIKEQNAQKPNTEDQKEATQVGLGFIITQQNSDEIDKFYKLAQHWDVDFIRYKPDIRPTSRLYWRTWKEAEEKVFDLINKHNTSTPYIYITNIPWNKYKVPNTETCWAQFFYTTVNPHGHVCKCDHLTLCREDMTIGNLSDNNFKNIWSTGIKNNTIGKKTPVCSICPPLCWRINELFEVMSSLYKTYGKQQLIDWLSEI